MLAYFIKYNSIRSAAQKIKREIFERMKGRNCDGPGLFWQTLEGELYKRRGSKRRSYRGGNCARLERGVMPANMLLYPIQGAPPRLPFSLRCLVALLVIVIIAYLSVFPVFFYAI